MTESYLSEIETALLRYGVSYEFSWTGPAYPREGSILLTDGRVLIWDEETGCRIGPFDGKTRNGRTRLLWHRYLCADVLPHPDDVAEAVAATPQRRPRGEQVPYRYRSHRDRGDGFEERLEGYALTMEQ